MLNDRKKKKNTSPDRYLGIFWRGSEVEEGTTYKGRVLKSAEVL